MDKEQKPFKPVKSGTGNFEAIFDINEMRDMNEEEAEWFREQRRKKHVPFEFEHDGKFDGPSSQEEIGNRRNSGIFEEVMSSKFSWSKEEFKAMKVGSDEDGEEEEDNNK